MRKEFPPYISYLIAALMSVAVLAMQTTLPFKVKELGGDLGAVGFLFTWSSAWYIAAGMGLGWLSHHFGPRRVMLVTLAFSMGLVIWMVYTTAMWQLYVLQTLYYVAICVFWAATEHASTGLHSRLNLVQSTAIFCVAFSGGNAFGILLSTTLQAQTMAVPFYLSAVMTLTVWMLTWVTVSPQAGFHKSSATDIGAFPEESRQAIRRALRVTRTGMIGVYGAYALTSLFLPRYLWEERHFSKPLAGVVTSAMLVAMALTFGIHGLKTGWTHRLWPVRLCPLVSALALLVVGHATHPALIAAGAMAVGIAAATNYTHNLYYSLEEPGLRARRAGLHEAVVGIAFMVPPALSGLATRASNSAIAIFSAGAALALAVGLAQNMVLLVSRTTTGRPS
jgi:MFS family permease